MASKEISALTAAAALTGAEKLHVDQGGNSRRTTTADIAALAGLQFITSIDLSNDATAEFTGFDPAKYDAYLFVLQNVIPATDSVYLACRTSTDGGSTYDSGASDYRYVNSTQADNNTNVRSYSTAASHIALTHSVNGSGYEIGSDTGEDGVSGLIWLPGPHLAKKTMIKSDLTLWCDYSTAIFACCTGAGIRNSSADVDAIQFFASSGLLGSGAISMYALKNS